MIVLVDHELLAEESSSWSKESLLSGLLTHPYVQVVRFADGGPPSSVERVESPWAGECVPGWAVLDPRDEESGEVLGFTTGDGGTVTRHGIHGNLSLIARNDKSNPVYSDLEAAEASRRREADALGALVAENLAADLYITQRKYLTGERKGQIRNALICTPQQALPLVSLYLRRQGVFVYLRAVDGFEYRCSQRIYFFTGALDLLPSVWRWSHACRQYAAGVSDESLPALCSSMIQRVERALQSRDDLFAALNVNGNRGSTDAALRSLDAALIYLTGAFDAAARVAHRVLGMTNSPRNAMWQSPNWLQRVRAVAPKLAAIFDPDSDAQHLLEILRKFRNSVHSEALSPLTVKEGSHPERILVGLPREDMEETLASMDSLGGRSSWGVESLWDSRMHAEPGVLLAKTFERSIEVLNAIMENTPVENLPNVRLTPAQCLPPSDPSDRYSQMKREGVRWQLGLE